MKKLLLTLLLASVALSHAAPAPTLIPFQGRLTDQQGAPYNTGQYTLIFNLYDQAVGGNVLWTETHQKVGVINGTVNVFLGSINAALASVDFSQSRYLGITIDADNNPNTPDPEMVPRQMIIPAIYSKQAGNTFTLAGFDWSAVMTSTNPATASLRSDKFPTGGIQSQHIAANAVTSTQLASGSVGSNHLASSILDQLVPAGTILPFGGAAVPSGWLLCDGQAASRTTYSRLYAAIGLTWGVGDASTSFNVPDLRGRMTIGAGLSGKNDIAGRQLSTRAFGGYGGEEVHLLTKAELARHSHDIGRGDRTQPGSMFGFGSNARSDYGLATGAALPEGNDVPHNVMNPFAVVNYIIKY